jgi:hypothetical protein
LARVLLLRARFGKEGALAPNSFWEIFHGGPPLSHCELLERAESGS